MIPKKPAGVTWTDEQWEAIMQDNRNIIVSAGAGSGKTAVLTERVIRKLKDGVNVNELLILTFTKAAAMEMSDRIRKKIRKIPELESQLNLLDSAYITTFDSFALAIVKRYHYLLNIPPNIGIIDSSLIRMKKQELMNNLFLKYYEEKNEMFLKLIDTFCTKDDSDILNYFLSISEKLDLLSNKKEYLKTYLDNYFKTEKIQQDIKSYVILIQKKMHEIKLLVNEIGNIDSSFAQKLDEVLHPFYNNPNYSAYLPLHSLKLPISPRGSSDEVKELKKKITDIIKEVKELLVYEDESEIIEIIKGTYDTVKIMIDILLEFFSLIDAYKQENNSYEFHDIAIMSIQILKKYKWVQEELSNSFNEIMIDEYQDTNDLQEEFISMISHDNVYMVGDIKQSIYRFRNANPYIFKNKYDSYSSSQKDLKIDLNKNFRSRKEVLDNINIIFNLVMDDVIGGADYVQSHQMIFGNKAYLKEDTKCSNDMEIYQYHYDKEFGFSKEEIEAFIIGYDIKNKYDNHYQVFDKDKGLLRDIEYRDFSIIMDRASSFDLYKKIFNYLKIPVNLLKDQKMNDDDDIHVIRNLIKFIIKVHKREHDTEFRYLFVSILRSFLYQVEDEEIFDYFLLNNYYKSNLYQEALKISLELDVMSIHELLDMIIEKFHYYEQYITIGNVQAGIIKFHKIREISLNLENLGYDIEMFSNYLESFGETGLSLEYKTPDTGADAVFIMTIHKSKGLEYPICYFSGLYKTFNISDLKERFLFDLDYGLIVPYFKEGIGQTIYKNLLKDKFLKEEISEKIRLFYVAMTRAREKMILVTPYYDEVNLNARNSIVDTSIRAKYRSLSDILNSVYFRIKNYYTNIDLTKIRITKDYDLILKSNNQKKLLNQGKIIEVMEVTLKNEVMKEKTFSKKTNQLLDKKTVANMEKGTLIHEYLEFLDFKNPDYSLMDDFSKDLIQNFLSSKIMNRIQEGIIYKEMEFVYEENNEVYHGIIDLMVEYDNYIDIIDYKLKNVLDDAYKKQLKGYYDYVSRFKKKEIRVFLYSLIEKKFLQIF